MRGFAELQMRCMTIRRVVAALQCGMLVLVATTAATAQGTAPSIPAEQLSRLETRLESLTGKGFSGVVLIQRSTETIFDRAFGSVHGRRVQRNDLFWVASISKSFTAAAAMKCREQGRIRLDDPIARYLYKVPEDKQRITLRQLLTHTSGLPQSYVSEELADREQAVQALLREKLTAAPGEKFGYSNANYELVAAIVEIVNGRPFEEFVRTEVLRPAGLEDTGFWFDRAAREVSPTLEPLPTRLQHRGWELGAGGMYSSVEDLARWSQALWQGRVVGEESTKMIFSDQVKISEGQSGFGWFHGRSPKGTEFWFTRGNDSFGPNALIYFYPAKQITVVVTSHGGDDAVRDMGWSRVALQEVIEGLEL